MRVKVEPGRQTTGVPRRRFLGYMVGAAAVTATDGFLRPSAGEAATVPSGGTQAGPAVTRPPRYSTVDGLLANFVRGPLAGIEGTTLTLEMPAGVGLRTEAGPVYVTLLGSTNVHGRGLDVQGSTAPLRLGDDLAIGTTLLASGERVARWMVANMRVGHMQISGTPNGEIVGVHMQRMVTPTNITSRLTVTPGSQIMWGSPTPLQPSRDIVQYVQPGQFLSYVGSRDIDNTVANELHVWIATAAPYKLSGS